MYLSVTNSGMLTFFYSMFLALNQKLKNMVLPGSYRSGRCVDVREVITRRKHERNMKRA